jgi:hypothetical protein
LISDHTHGTAEVPRGTSAITNSANSRKLEVNQRPLADDDFPLPLRWPGRFRGIRRHRASATRPFATEIGHAVNLVR